MAFYAFSTYIDLITSGTTLCLWKPQRCYTALAYYFKVFAQQALYCFIKYLFSSLWNIPYSPFFLYAWGPLRRILKNRILESRIGRCQIVFINNRVFFFLLDTYCWARRRVRTKWVRCRRLPTEQNFPYSCLFFSYCLKHSFLQRNYIVLRVGSFGTFRTKRERGFVI